MCKIIYKKIDNDKISTFNMITVKYQLLYRYIKGKTSVTEVTEVNNIIIISPAKPGVDHYFV